MNEAIVILALCGALYALFVVFILGWSIGYGEAERAISKKMSDLTISNQQSEYYMRRPQ